MAEGLRPLPGRLVFELEPSRGEEALEECLRLVDGLFLTECLWLGEGLSSEYL